MQDTSHHEHLATRGERLLAVVLEIVIFVGVGFGFMWIGNFVFKQGWVGRTSEFGDLLGGAVIIGLVVIQIVLMVKRSQTVGKYFLDLQVVRVDNEKRIGFWKYSIIRTFIGETLIVGALPIFNFIFQPIYSVVDVMFIFRKDRRTLHDLIAGTKVIHLAPEKRAKSFFDFSKL